MRRRADEALKATDERFRTVFEEGGCGIALVGVGLRVLQANGVLCQMLGYTEPELMKMTLGQVIVPDDAPGDGPAVELASRVFAGDTSVYRQEQRFVHKNGQLVDVALTVSAVRSPDGTPRYGIAMVEDITQRRRVELELRQAQKLEGIGMLAGGIAHNFNNVLTAISGYTELLMREPGLPDRAKGYAEKVLEVTHRSGDLTAQLLAFSRRQVTEAHLFDLSAAVRSAESALAPLVGEAVTLQTRLHPTPCRVSADRVDIEQVIVNLVLNARDAMPDGGTVTIETDTVDPPAELFGTLLAPRRDGYVSLVVRDTGIGMRPEIVAQVFDPFFTTKAQGGGVGLGLAMAHGAVKQAGGHISVASDLGVGTTFTVYLPLGTGGARLAAQG